MEGADDGGAVSGNHGGWTQAQGCARYHHGRGDSGAGGDKWTKSAGRRLIHGIPRSFAGPAPPAIPLSASPLGAPPAPAPTPAHPGTAIAPTELFGRARQRRRGGGGGGRRLS